MDDGGRRLTLVGLRAKKTKAIQKECASGFFAPDPLRRVLGKRVAPASKYDGAKKRRYSEVSGEDRRRCAEHVARFARTVAWRTFALGAAVIEGAAAPPGTDSFTKRTTSFAEIEISAALHCVTVAKGLPPFVFELQGFKRAEDGEFRVSVAKSRGRSLQAYLDERLGLGLDLHLDAVLAQVCLALRSFQKYAGFVHNDLHTHNIVVEDRGDAACYVARLDGQWFSFPPDAPFVRLVDFGQSALVHPLRDRTCSSVFTGPIVRDVSCADVSKLMVCLVKWALSQGKGRAWPDVLGRAAAEDVRAVMAHLTDGETTVDDVARYAATENVNSEYFPMELGTSLDALIREGACARAFAIPEPGRCRFSANIFFEREDDLFCSRRAIARFKDREAPFAIFEIELDRRVVPVATEAVREVFESNVSACLGRRGIVRERSGVSWQVDRVDGKPRVFHFQRTDAFLRRRAAWKMLELFQRGVLLYLKLFVARDVAGGVREPVARIRREVALFASGEHDAHARFFTLCLIAVTGDCEPFFSRRRVADAFGTEHAANATAYRSARNEAMKLYDSVRYGTACGRDGVRVPASSLTHEDAYEDVRAREDFPLYHFDLARNPLFYGRAT